MELFKHTGYAPDITAVNWQQVPAIIRVLLTTDGTVTKSLEAYFWEPISVVRTGQDVLSADLDSRVRFLDNQPECDALSRSALWRREVDLVGQQSKTTYVSASSLIDPAKLPRSLAEGLSQGQLGIGGVIRELGLETYREIVGVGQGSNNTLWRSYRLYFQHEVLMQIRETFHLQHYF